MKTLISAVFLIVPLFCGALPPTGNNKLGIECYKCSSEDLADCAINPTADLPKSFCKDPADQCITAVVDTVTQRGCKKELNAPSNAISNVCGTSHCNNKLFPENRLKCYQCKGKDCVKDFQNTLKLCVNYDKADNCITNVIDENDVIRGCQSDRTYSEESFVEKCHVSGCNNQSATTIFECVACSGTDSKNCARLTTPHPLGHKCAVPKEKTCKDTILLNRKPIQCFTYKTSDKLIRGCVKDAGKLLQDTNHLKTCEGPFCNNECLPTKCVKCNSKTNPKCADHANELHAEQCASETACFAARTTDGGIERGCGEQFKNASEISVCYEDGCNNKILPLQCYKCDSKHNADCATNPSASLQKEQCLDSTDKCVTAIIEGTTYRGCDKEVNPPVKALSEKCDKNLCNSSIFPEQRLKCYQCKGKECVKDFEKHLKPCVNYRANDMCVTIVEDDSNIIRKCSSDSDYKGSKYAEECKESGCNKHPARYTAECLTCSQINATTCARQGPLPESGDCKLPKDTTCKDTPLLNRPISCFTYESAGKVVRGCTKDAGKLALEKQNFKTCEGELCNNKCLHIKCVNCDSRNDQRCFKQTNAFELETCPFGTSCFIGQTSDGGILRGCGPLSKEAKNNTPCYYDGCNSKSFPVPKKCYRCNSNILAECATSPSASLPKYQCKDPNDKCITAIFAGNTYRGCEKEVAPAYTVAEKCDKDLCNINVYPKDRVKCYQCKGKECVKDFEKHLKPCVNYGANDMCVTIVEDDSNITRKCSSDPGYLPSKYAVTCKGSACNKQPATYTAECLTCSQINATSCARKSPLNASGECKLPKDATCKDTLLLNRPISCFTYESAGKVVRGCTKDAGKLALEKQNFKTCEGELCNNKCLPIKCVSCDSRKDPKCFNQTNDLKPEICSSGTSCFIGQTSDGAILRGCGEQSKEANHSIPCNFDGCNNKSFPVPKKCYKCNSKLLADCAINPSANLPKEQCKDPKDKCATAIIEGVTYRGCEKEVNAPVKALSEKCDKDLCNINIFPKDRLQCYQCKGQCCVKDLEKQLKPCVNYGADNLCVTVVENDSTIIRKCLSDPGYSAPKYAVTCKGSACNKQPATYTAECLSCSQTNATSCARTTPLNASGECKLPKDATCKDTLLLNRPISCFTYELSGKVVRGCTKDAGKLALDKNNFKTCEGELCNNKCLPIKCVSCDSRKDPRCFNQSNELKPQICSSGTSCFIGQTSDGDIIRGCGEQSREANHSTPCNFDGCNNKSFPVPIKKQCYTCNSKVLADCATNPSASLPKEQCKDPKDKCISAIIEGDTHRGCEKEVNAPAYAHSEKCDKNMCNFELFPKDRVKCYQCKGKECVNDFEKYLKPCIKYGGDSLCVTIVENESNITRKCSTVPGYLPSKYAETCKGLGCNKHPATYTAECLSCSQTNATSCARTTPLNASGECKLPKDATCKDTLLLNRPISCFTYESAGKVVRGCTKDAGKLALDKNNFKTCEGELCNNKCLPIKCVSCDSRKDPRCFNQTNELKPQICSSGTSCFIGQTSDGDIIRGCGEQSKEANHSIPCNFDGCNNKSFPVPIKKQCYTCNSKVLADCATNPSASLPKEQCKDPKDKCISAIIEGDTHRGCEKEVNAPAYAHSEKCDKNMCNFELFPKDRVKCYQCKGKECVNDFEKYLKPCIKYGGDSLCVTIVENESNITRKCSTDPGYFPTKYTETCKGSGCNKHPATYTSECLSCSQTNATSCARTTPLNASGECKLPKDATCKDTLLLTRPISCFTYEASGKVVRGCTKDAGKLALDKQNFKTCEGELCNNKCLPIKCVSCDSRTNPECAKQTNNLEPQACSSNERNCFIGQTSDGAIIRGCGSKSAEAIQIASCSTDGCNKVYKVFPNITKIECYKCSSINLPECANNPSGNLPRGYCNDSTDQCITAIVDGITYRGCEKEVKTSASSITGICKSNLCNVDKFKLPDYGVISQKEDNYKYNNNNFSNNNNNNNNSNNNNNNKVFIQFINFNFGKFNNTSEEIATAT